MTTTPLEAFEIEKLTLLTPEGWPSIIPHFDFYTTSNFCFPIKITINHEIVGIGTTIIHENTAWLAHIIVHPNYRNKGIGKKVTQKLVAQAHQKKCNTILLIATELGAYVYEKLGFITDSEYVFYRIPENAQKHIPSKFIVPYSEDMKKEVLAFDAKISGENRSENIIPHLNNTFIYLHNKVVEGIFIPTLGEGTIMATTAKAGIELLKLRLNTHKNVIFPKENTAAYTYMSNNKHEVVYRAKRMRLGNKIPVKLSNIYARIGGNLG